MVQLRLAVERLFGAGNMATDLTLVRAMDATGAVPLALVLEDAGVRRLLPPRLAFADRAAQTAYLRAVLATGELQHVEVVADPTLPEAARGASHSPAEPRLRPTAFTGLAAFLRRESPSDPRLVALR